MTDNPLKTLDDAMLDPFYNPDDLPNDLHPAYTAFCRARAKGDPVKIVEAIDKMIEAESHPLLLETLANTRADAVLKIPRQPWSWRRPFSRGLSVGN